MLSAPVAPAPVPTGPVPSTSAAAQKAPTFEFTRRKRWAELLVHELSEAVALVLSPAGKIWFCSPGVADLLGWRDEELIDSDVADLVHADDSATFRAALDGAVRAQKDVVAYVRLKGKSTSVLSTLNASAAANTLGGGPPSPYAGYGLGGDYGYAIPTAGTSTSVPAQPPPLPLGPSAPPAGGAGTGLAGKEVLFEVAAYPHCVAHESDIATECKCIFAVAKPYPSRNTAMLNTFLELKVENERLQEKLADLKAPKNRAAAYGPPPPSRPLPFRRASQSQSAYSARPMLPPLTTTTPAAGFGPAGATSAGAAAPYPVSVSVAMPMDMASLASAASLASYTYPPAPAGTGAFYPMDPSAGAYASAGAGPSSAGGYSDYAQLLPPSTPTDRYGAYGNVLGMPGAEPRPEDRRGSLRPEDRRGSLGGMRHDLTVDKGRRASDAVAPADGADDDERGKKKKKVRHPPDQFVCRTCGRTDSPEWRKGPDGPKTLCNACGLRWAKQVRKGDDGAKGAGAADGDAGE